MDKRVSVIVFCLLFAAVLTLLIFRAANLKSAELRRTVDVVRVTQYIPPGSTVRPDQVEAAKVSEAAGKEYVLTLDQVVGRTARVGLVEGQYVHPNALGGQGLSPGAVEVDVPVDQSSSAAVIAGDVVDVYAIGKDAKDTAAQLLLRGVRVLHSYDSDGNEISPDKKKEAAAGPPGSRIPASVGLEVPRDAAGAVVQAASQKRIYLAKACPAG